MEDPVLADRPGGDRREDLLAETAWLAEHLADPALRVVDMRGSIRPPDQPKPWYFAKREEYLQAHIPGGVFLDWLVDIVEPDAHVPMTLAGPERFAAAMARLGIGDAQTVVVYDDLGGHIAARLWWALNYYGHPAVKLLNGGYPKWVAEGRPVTSETPSPSAARFTPRTQPRWRVGSAQVRSLLGDPNVRIVDCRSPAEFRGEVGRGERKGRIPGAIHVPFAQMVEGEHRTFKSHGELTQLFAAAGVTAERRAITYCNAGVTASAGLFALKLVGHPAATNFAGSWYEWERDPANPTEMG